MISCKTIIIIIIIVIIVVVIIIISIYNLRIINKSCLIPSFGKICRTSINTLSKS